MHTTGNTEARGLVRGLGIWAATAVIIGSMVGQSIFLVTSVMARDVGSTGRVLAAWVTGGLVVLCAAFCYAELGAALPEAGGEFVYLGRGLGPPWGFLYGWTSALLQGPATAATIAAGMFRIAGFLVPAISTTVVMWSVSLFPTHPLQVTLTVAQIGAAAAIAVVVVINCFGVRTAGTVQVFLTSFKVAAIVFVVVLGLTAGRAVPIDPVPVTQQLFAGAIPAFLTALVPVLSAYNGFQALGHIGGEITDPPKNIPRAAIIGVVVVVALYGLINVAYFRVLGFARVAQSSHVASDAVVALAGASGAQWLTVLMIVSALGALHVNVLARPRVPYAMARDGQFFGFIKRVQPRFHTPIAAIMFHGGVAVALVLTGTFEEIYSLNIFSIWVFTALTAVALIRLRVREPGLPRPYRAWAYPWTPLLVTAVGLAIAVNLWMVRPIRCSIGLALTLLGLPFFYRWRRQRAEAC